MVKLHQTRRVEPFDLKGRTGNIVEERQDQHGQSYSHERCQKRHQKGLAHKLTHELDAPRPDNLADPYFLCPPG